MAGLSKNSSSGLQQPSGSNQQNVAEEGESKTNLT
jgi:hypothetical protein